MARLKITQVKSRIGSTERQCKNLDALGLKRINASVEHDDSVIIKGMIARVKHLVKVEEVAPAKKAAPKAKKAEAESVATEIASGPAAPDASTPEAVESPPVAAASEPTTDSKARPSRRKAAASDAPAEPVVSSTVADPAADAPREDKPKRAGWWQRKGFF